MTAVLVGLLHEPRSVAAHLPELPLCWVAEGEQRGATVEEWEITFDQVLDPLDEDEIPTFVLRPDGAEPTCPECLGWLHA